MCFSVKVNETEVYVDGHDFKFFSNPYFLRYLTALVILITYTIMLMYILFFIVNYF